MSRTRGIAAVAIALAAALPAQITLPATIDDVGGPGPKRGFQIVFIGPAVGGEFTPPFGVLLTGTLGTSAVVAAQPTGTPFPLPIPDRRELVGERSGLQMVVISDLGRPAGNLTNAMLATITQ